MEKRVFALSPKRNRCAEILIWLCAGCNGLVMWLFWHNGMILWWQFGIPMFLMAWLFYVSPQASQLEISDEGMSLKQQRGVGYLLRWDAITSVRIHTHSDAARLWLAVIKDSYGRVVRIPRMGQDSAEVLNILKQRLPESAFQTW